MVVDYVKIVVFVPETHADFVRQALGKAGAGKMGNYDFCFFSSKGEGQFRPLDGAHPVAGTVGKLTVVAEERIETICPKAIVSDVVKAIKVVHPYEEPVIDIYPLAKKPEIQ